jgi:hypothetical protein
MRLLQAQHHFVLLLPIVENVAMITRRHAVWLHRWNVLYLYKMVNLVCVRKIRIVNRTSGITSPWLCWSWSQIADRLPCPSSFAPPGASLSNVPSPITWDHSICYLSEADEHLIQVPELVVRRSRGQEILIETMRGSIMHRDETSREMVAVVLATKLA